MSWCYTVPSAGSTNIDRLLTAIESAELPLLSWGVVHASFTEEEILEVIEKVENQEDPDDLLDELVDRRLVVQTLEGQFRSRMAETLRLTTQLRQWFPGKRWDHAPSLVSDFRFASATRTVPSRTIRADQVVGRLNDCRAECHLRRERFSSVLWAIANSQSSNSTQQMHC